MSFRSEGRSHLRMYDTPKPSKSSRRTRGSGDRDDNLNPSGRRAMRNLVRFRNRKAGLYYDGTPFKGHVRSNGHSRQMPPADASRTKGILPLPQPLPAPNGFCINSESKRESQGELQSPPI